MTPGMHRKCPLNGNVCVLWLLECVIGRKSILNLANIWNPWNIWRKDHKISFETSLIKLKIVNLSSNAFQYSLEYLIMQSTTSRLLDGYDSDYWAISFQLNIGEISKIGLQSGALNSFSYGLEGIWKMCLCCE